MSKENDFNKILKIIAIIISFLALLSLPFIFLIFKFLFIGGNAGEEIKENINIVVIDENYQGFATTYSAYDDKGREYNLNKKQYEQLINEGKGNYILIYYEKNITTYTNFGKDIIRIHPKSFEKLD